MIIIDDNDVCPICGAYWQSNGYCCNGHPKNVLYKKDTIEELAEEGVLKKEVIEELLELSEEK